MLARSKLLKGNEPNEVLMFVPFFLKETKNEKSKTRKHYYWTHGFLRYINQSHPVKGVAKLGNVGYATPNL